MPATRARPESKLRRIANWPRRKTNPNWRNWYITSQRELLGLGPRKAIDGGLTSRDIVINLPYYAWVNEWTMRLKADETIAGNVHRNLGIWIEGTNDGFGPEGYLLRLRRAVFEFIDTKANRKDVDAGADLVLSMDRDTMRDLIIADRPNDPNAFLDTLTAFIDKGRIHAKGGGAAEARAFFEHFDRAPDKAIPLSLR